MKMVDATGKGGLILWWEVRIPNNNPKTQKKGTEPK